MGKTGFEPGKVKPGDLQSALVGRLSNSPFFRKRVQKYSFFFYIANF